MKKGDKKLTHISGISDSSKSPLKKKRNFTYVEEQIQPIDLHDPLNTSQREEFLRILKEKETIDKHAKIEANKKKIKDIKEMQTQWQKLSKEKNIKNFTYDYDGTMIIILNNEKEKLPPIQQAINFDLKDYDPKSLKSKRETVKKNPRAQKAKLIETEKDPMKIGSPIPVEEFDLKPGVTLYYMGGSKRGAKPLNTVDRLMNPNVRLTKTEYYDLTKGGNLSREKLINEERQINTAFESVPKEGDFLSKVVKTDGFKDLPKIHKTRMIDPLKYGSIRIDSSKLLDTMYDGDSNSIIQKEKAKKYEKKDFLMRDADKMKSEMDPIDNFNRELILSKDWGKTIPQGKFKSTQISISKPSIREIKSSIGIRLKKPRDRILDSLRPMSYKHLPPQRLGQDIGHQYLKELTFEANESKERSFFN